MKIDYFSNNIFIQEFKFMFTKLAG